MRFKEIVNEDPQAMAGDWLEGDVFVVDKSLMVYKNKWRKVGSMTIGAGNYDIATCIRFPFSYIVGKEEPNKAPNGKFVVVGVLDLEEIPNNPYGYTKLCSVDHVVVRETLQGNQIATELYRFVVKSGITLLSDMSQYFGARRLWSRISKHTDMIVDVIDTKKQTIAAQDQGKV